MILYTKRLLLRPWTEADATNLYEYAKNPAVGPIAGWPPHKSVEESLNVIRNVFDGAECYAICEKENEQAIGAVELKLNGHTDMTERDDECELGYWLGQPFWGRGYMPEAAARLIRHGFCDLGMTTIWCGYYDGNIKSKRVQEKLGLQYHHTCEDVEVPLMNEIRVGHTNYITKVQWLAAFTC
ncbi:MAG: GNAT family N-acetyltransferase [Clostridia bacterium]|mgnify:CR=1 FL=1|nr:GNAT family N-acetyltransferase [Clostridia bacterium]